MRVFFWSANIFRVLHEFCAGFGQTHLKAPGKNGDTFDKLLANSVTTGASFFRVLGAGGSKGVLPGDPILFADTSCTDAEVRHG